MIRQPDDADLPQLEGLWQEAFGDSEQEARSYFKNRHRHEYMLLEEDEGQISGMMSMLPLELHASDRRLKARYVFAVATKMEYRGKGVSTRLLQEAQRRMAAEGVDASLLVPASPSLFEYYGKRGYQDAFFIDEIRVKPGEIKKPGADSSAEPCGADEYLRARDAFYAGSSLYARWDLEALRFASNFESAGESVMLKMRIGGQEAIAVCVDRGSFFRVSELACDKALWQEAMALIHQRVRASAYVLRMREGSLPDGSTRPFGMIHWFSEQVQEGGSPAYLAFAKD